MFRISAFQGEHKKTDTADKVNHLMRRLDAVKVTGKKINLIMVDFEFAGTPDRQADKYDEN
jgi:hypothetical protein